MSKKYLETFFKEKQIEQTSWELTGLDGTPHFIDSDVVIEAILNCPSHEQKKIADVLRQLDFRNQKIEPFLEHMAKGLVANWGAI